MFYHVFSRKVVPFHKNIFMKWNYTQLCLWRYCSLNGKKSHSFRLILKLFTLTEQYLITTSSYYRSTKSVLQTAHIFLSYFSYNSYDKKKKNNNISIFSQLTSRHSRIDCLSMGKWNISIVYWSICKCSRVKNYHPFLACYFCPISGNMYNDDLIDLSGGLWWFCCCWFTCCCKGERTCELVALIWTFTIFVG